MTYLLGDQDTNPYDSSLDTGCEAERQGPHRLARGRAFSTTSGASTALRPPPSGW